MESAPSIKNVVPAASQPLKASAVTVANGPVPIDEVDGLLDAIKDASHVSWRSLFRHGADSFMVVTFESSCAKKTDHGED